MPFYCRSEFKYQCILFLSLELWPCQQVPQLQPELPRWGEDQPALTTLRAPPAIDPLLFLHLLLSSWADLLGDQVTCQWSSSQQKVGGVLWRHPLIQVVPELLSDQYQYQIIIKYYYLCMIYLLFLMIDTPPVTYLMKKQNQIQMEEYLK